MNLSYQKGSQNYPGTKPPVLPPALPDTDDDRMPPAVIAAISAAVALLLLLLILMILMLAGRPGGNSGAAGNGVAKDNAGDSLASSPDALDQGTEDSDGLIDTPTEKTDGSNAEAERGDGDSDAMEGNTDNPDPGTEASTIDWAKEEGDLFANSGTLGIGSFTQSGVKMFGIEGKGRNIVYVVDRSSSMAGAVYNHDANLASAVGTRFELACNELIRSVNGLKSDQVFTILFFNEGVLHDASFVASSPTSDTRRELEAFVKQIAPSGGTNPLPAVSTALDKNFLPAIDVMFLLSDGEFEQTAVDQIKIMNANRAVIHTISMLNNAVTLEQIANQNGGRYVTAK